MTVADVDDVKIAGLLFEAGTTNSPDAAARSAPPRSTRQPRGQPDDVQDVYCRVGGKDAGKATNSFVVNSNNVIVDNIWAWRADHGSARPAGRSTRATPA